jgi:DNA-binding transcriptional LysR family regulator
MDVRDLVTLAAVAKFGSITKAADQLGVTQPGITKIIKALEKELRVPLIDRTRNGAIPTKFGEILVRYGATIVTEFNKSRAELFSMIEGALGTVTVGTIAMGTGHIVPIAIHRVSQRFPGVSIGIREVSDDVLFSGLQTGMLDVVFAPVTSGEKGHFEEDTLFHDKLQICVGSSNPLTRRKRLTLGALLSHDWIMPPRTSRLFQKITREFEYFGSGLPENYIETTSIRAQFALVIHANRIAMIPGRVIEPEVTAGRIVALPVRLQNPIMKFGTATRAGATLSPAVKELVREIRAVADEVGWLERQPSENTKTQK